MVKSEEITLSGNRATLRGYLARPEAEGAFPGIVVVHEAFGVSGFIRGVADRLAGEGFAALAPDLMSRPGGMLRFMLPQVHRALLGASPQQQAVKDLLGTVSYLQGRDGVRRDRIGVIGFCLGGGLTLALAAASDQVTASVAFYGRGPASLDAVANIRGPVLSFHGEDDWFVRGSVPRLRGAMERHGKSLEVHAYPKAGHGFMNEEYRNYQPAAAEDAWRRTLGFFRAHLAGEAAMASSEA